MLCAAQYLPAAGGIFSNSFRPPLLSLPPSSISPSYATTPSFCSAAAADIRIQNLRIVLTMHGGNFERDVYISESYSNGIGGDILRGGFKKRLATPT